MEHLNDVEVLLLKENTLSLEVFVDKLLLLFDRLRLSVNLSQDHSYLVHLALGECLHLFEHLALAHFAGGGLEVVDELVAVGLGFSFLE